MVFIALYRSFTDQPINKWLRLTINANVVMCEEPEQILWMESLIHQQQWRLYWLNGECVD